MLSRRAVSGSLSADTSGAGQFVTLATPDRRINLLELQNGETRELNGVPVVRDGVPVAGPRASRCMPARWRSWRPVRSSSRASGAWTPPSSGLSPGQPSPPVCCNEQVAPAEVARLERTWNLAVAGVGAATLGQRVEVSVSQQTDEWELCHPRVGEFGPWIDCEDTRQRAASPACASGSRRR